jgi:hypothetical protein
LAEKLFISLKLFNLMASLLFQKPATESAYRLRVSEDGETWRIAKTRTVNGQLVIRHLAGTTASSDVDLNLIDQLLRGSQSIPKGAGDPHRAFSQVVLSDLDRTYAWLVAIAREAEQRKRNGYPGFRANSPQLRRDAENAANTALLACADMAAAWRASGLEAVGVVPEWLSAALGDVR